MREIPALPCAGIETLPLDVVAMLGSVTARDVMTANPIVASPPTMAFDAPGLMGHRPSQIAMLPLVQNSRCIGLLRLHDLVRTRL